MSDFVRFDHKEDNVIKVIGSGTYGTVAKVKNSGYIYARKSMIVMNNINDIINELAILKSLKHKNIVAYYGYSDDKTENRFYIYTRYYEKGDLFDLIDNRSKSDFPDDQLLKYMIDLVNGLIYIHQKNLIHRDLKSPNIFIGNDDELVIGDFGLTNNSNNTDDRVVGTFKYIAPEIWDSHPPKYTTYTDIYALGCIFYELYTLRLLHQGENKKEIRADILDDNKTICYERNDKPRIERLESVIKKMLSYIAEERGSLDEIRNELISIKSEIITTSSINPTDTKLTANNNETSTLSHSNQDSSVSTSLLSTHNNHLSLILNFYLENGTLKEKTLNEISDMTTEEFSSYWDDDLLFTLFPEVDQKETQFTEEDLETLKLGKRKFQSQLQNIINNLKNMPSKKYEEYEDRIVKFLSSIEKSLDSSSYDTDTQSYDNTSGSCNYNSLILNIYLQNGGIKGKTLNEISEMSIEELDSFWDDELFCFFFPSINQDNPPYTKDDANILKSEKSKFHPQLQKMINYLLNLPKVNQEEYKDRIIIFLSSIDETFDHFMLSIVDFYLNNACVKGITIKEYSEMTEIEFVRKWEDYLLNWFFPQIGQDYPVCTYKDLMKLNENIKIIQPIIFKLILLVINVYGFGYNTETETINNNCSKNYTFNIMKRDFVRIGNFLMKVAYNDSADLFCKVMKKINEKIEINPIMVVNYLSSYSDNTTTTTTSPETISDKYSVGCAFGISNIYCGVYENEKCEILSLDGIKNNLRNIVYFSPKSCQVLAGEQARCHINESNQCIYDFNRIIELEYDSNEVIKMKERFNIIDKNNKPIFKVEYSNSMYDLSPSDIISEILVYIYRSLKKHFNSKPDDKFNVVVAVPLFYSERQRNEVKLIFQKQFHKSNITVIPDFSSIVIGYIYNNEKQEEIAKMKEEIVLVYDFGESTFKVSLVKVNYENKIIKLLEKECDMDLGGKNIDECIMNNYICKYLCVDGTDIDSNKMNELKDECKKVKYLLSSKECESAELNCEWLKCSGIDCKLQRNEFDEMCDDIYVKTMKYVDDIIEKSHFSQESISTVILVGGSSKIMKIRNLMSEKFIHSKIMYDIENDELNIAGCIAYGNITNYKFIIEE